MTPMQSRPPSTVVMSFSCPGRKSVYPKTSRRTSRAVGREPGRCASMGAVDTTALEATTAARPSRGTRRRHPRTCRRRARCLAARQGQRLASSEGDFLLATLAVRLASGVDLLLRHLAVLVGVQLVEALGGAG